MAKILVIDDDPDIVLSVRTTLEKAGHKVIEAPNGREGLEKIRADTPDLIILDVMMDTSTEGFQLALRLRNPDPTSDLAEFGHIPILMLTAIHSTTPLRFEPDIDYLPVELFVDKPIDPDDLLKKVEWVLSGEKV
ncbi:MAG TPA: response regulator [Anaerolineales bacterium]|nr:response regulator [Anaerolineales bacterium]